MFAILKQLHLQIAHSQILRRRVLFEMMKSGAWFTMKIIESAADVKDVLLHF